MCFDSETLTQILEYSGNHKQQSAENMRVSKNEAEGIGT